MYPDNRGRGNEVDLKQLLASHSALPAAEAADQVDLLVADILRRLRKGSGVALPGVGILQPDPRHRVRLKPLPGKSKGERRR